MKPTHGNDSAKGGTVYELTSLPSLPVFFFSLVRLEVAVAHPVKVAHAFAQGSKCMVRFYDLPFLTRLGVGEKSRVYFDSLRGDAGLRRSDH
jgi:hypothetical protein